MSQNTRNNNNQFNIFTVKNILGNNGFFQYNTYGERYLPGYLIIDLQDFRNGPGYLEIYIEGNNVVLEFVHQSCQFSLGQKTITFNPQNPKGLFYDILNFCRDSRFVITKRQAA